MIETIIKLFFLKIVYFRNLGKRFFSSQIRDLNPIQDGLFRGCSRMRGQKGSPSLKSATWTLQKMKLGPVITYPKKTQKIYESRDTSLQFC